VSPPGSQRTQPPGRRWPRDEPTGLFANLILQETERRGIRLPGSGAAPLAGLDYGLETELKDGALRRFWRQHALPGRPRPLIGSPRPRHYRTTSKRRCRPGAAGGADRKRGRTGIFFEGDEAALLEPREHRLIFASLEEWLAEPLFARLARALHFIIIRGTYAEFMVIFNFHAMDREVNRLLLKIAVRLRALPANVISAFVFIDPGRSPYYLEIDRPRSAFRIKRLFGPQRFRLALGPVVFSVPPTSFSQVNESMLPLLLGKAREALAGGSGRRLLDLYCGYGLFTLSLSDRFEEIIAIDAAPDAVRAGREQLASTATADPAAGRARVFFKAMTISHGNLVTALPPPLAPGEEDVILDPPRRGVDAAVVRSIAGRRPGRIVHLFCAIEELPRALGSWRQCGYFVRSVVPLDMFAGTPQLETLVLLSRP
jgi:tRNA/tmRNA/rRNA uracil-C5-methylase (TrmA/RlmC/RlmD family)